jgi:hypothetical protein
MSNNILFYTIIFFSLIMGFIYYTKPSIFFNNNKIKSFGIGKNKTFIPLPVMVVIIAIFSYALFFNICKTYPKHNMMNNIPVIQSTPQYTYKLVRTDTNGSILL